MSCDRCGEQTSAFTMSYFNTDLICLECRATEEAHPDFAEAKRIESEAVLQGNYHFPGVGLPADLRKRGEAM